MSRKAKSKDESTPTERQHGGYRHGVPGGGAQTHVQIPMTLDLKERWRAASIRAGHHETRGLSPFIVEAVEAYIKARKLEDDDADREDRSRPRHGRPDRGPAH